MSVEKRYILSNVTIEWLERKLLFDFAKVPDIKWRVGHEVSSRSDDLLVYSVHSRLSGGGAGRIEALEQFHIDTNVVKMRCIAADQSLFDGFVPDLIKRLEDCGIKVEDEI